MQEMIFELCAETIDACLAAREGGAHRIELCSGLSEGGITPSHGLILDAVERSGLPVHVLVRPRGGSFVYAASEIDVMRRDILHIKELGAAGAVFGILWPDGRVDVEATRALVQLARPLKVTFHRAFDATPSLPQALEDVITTGADRLLTSGGQPNVVAGSAALAELVRLAGDRIEIAIGGGLRLENAASLARATHAKHFHGSLRRRLKQTASPAEMAGESLSMGPQYVVDADDVRALIERLAKD
ncbi:copper homeostasis protein CutC [Granulicella sp. L46]|uniref:copper homeostasis protein CutC n=1 Tax=Granulicella sp. L46 TaxID=1641865 RepID=UPI00131B4D47|nr:copper homeostasis protein CutC [Granulicella sp. L46]